MAVSVVVVIIVVAGVLVVADAGTVVIIIGGVAVAIVVIETLSINGEVDAAMGSVVDASVVCSVDSGNEVVGSRVVELAKEVSVVVLAAALVVSSVVGCWKLVDCSVVMPLGAVVVLGLMLLVVGENVVCPAVCISDVVGACVEVPMLVNVDIIVLKASVVGSTISVDTPAVLVGDEVKVLDVGVVMLVLVAILLLVEVLVMLLDVIGIVDSTAAVNSAVVLPDVLALVIVLMDGLVLALVETVLVMTEVKSVLVLVLVVGSPVDPSNVVNTATVPVGVLALVDELMVVLTTICVVDSSAVVNAAVVLVEEALILVNVLAVGDV